MFNFCVVPFICMVNEDLLTFKKKSEYHETNLKDIVFKIKKSKRIDTT